MAKMVKKRMAFCKKYHNWTEKTGTQRWLVMNQRSAWSTRGPRRSGGTAQSAGTSRGTQSSMWNTLPASWSGATLAAMEAAFTVLFAPQNDHEQWEIHGHAEEELFFWMKLHKATHFIQDSVPCYTSKRVMKFLKENDISVLNWPRNSPDLNPHRKPVVYYAEEAQERHSSLPPSRGCGSWTCPSAWWRSCPTPYQRGWSCASRMRRPDDKVLKSSWGQLSNIHVWLKLFIKPDKNPSDQNEKSPLVPFLLLHIFQKSNNEIFSQNFPPRTHLGFWHEVLGHRLPENIFCKPTKVICCPSIRHRHGARRKPSFFSSVVFKYLRTRFCSHFAANPRSTSLLTPIPLRC